MQHVNCIAGATPGITPPGIPPGAVPPLTRPPSTTQSLPQFNQWSTAPNTPIGQVGGLVDVRPVGGSQTSRWFGRRLTARMTDTTVPLVQPETVAIEPPLLVSSSRQAVLVLKQQQQQREAAAYAPRQYPHPVRPDMMLAATAGAVLQEHELDLIQQQQLGRA